MAHLLARNLTLFVLPWLMWLIFLLKSRLCSSRSDIDLALLAQRMTWQLSVSLWCCTVLNAATFGCFREMTDQIELMQSDLDHMREVLSSGQYSLDPSILAGVSLTLQTRRCCVGRLLYFVTMFRKIRRLYHVQCGWSLGSLGLGWRLKGQAFISHYLPSEGLMQWVFDWLIDDRLYSAILRSLEQTHCACMWFNMSD